MRRAMFVVAAVTAIVASSGMAAQDRSGSSEPRFEVASVKPVDDRVILGYRPTPGQFTGQMALIDFISLAYVDTACPHRRWCADPERHLLHHRKNPR